MSADDSSNCIETVGTTKIRLAPAGKTKEENNYICTWNLEGDFESGFEGEKMSPIFTVPGRDECKWRLGIQAYGGDFAVDGTVTICSVRLYLDPSSDCESAVAKFSLQVFAAEESDARSLRWAKFRTFKFIKKSANSSGFMTTISSASEGDEAYELYEAKVLCRIKIVNVIPEDDSFLKDFESLLKDARFPDVDLLVGEKKFPAHKTILSARSSVFAAMFANNSRKKQDVVIIENMLEVVVEEMLRYIYTGEVQISEELAHYLSIAADKYDLKGLKSKCEGVLIERLTNENVISILLFAESCNASKLRSEAIHLIKENKTEVMKTTDWENLMKSNPALVREISDGRIQPEPGSESEWTSESDLESESDPESESELVLESDSTSESEPGDE